MKDASNKKTQRVKVTKNDPSTFSAKANQVDYKRNLNKEGPRLVPMDCNSILLISIFNDFIYIIFWCLMICFFLTLKTHIQTLVNRRATPSWSSVSEIMKSFLDWSEYPIQEELGGGRNCQKRDMEPSWQGSSFLLYLPSQHRQR